MFTHQKSADAGCLCGKAIDLVKFCPRQTLYGEFRELASSRQMEGESLICAGVQIRSDRARVCLGFLDRDAEPAESISRKCLIIRFIAVVENLLKELFGVLYVSQFFGCAAFPIERRHAPGCVLGLAG